MSLKQWQSNGWLRLHQTSFQEIENLLTIVERDLVDSASQNLSVDWRFGIAYNAVLKLCTILLYASGYKPEKLSAHARTLASLPLILGKNHESDAAYLNTCRIKRNETEYDFAGSISEDEASELMAYALELKPAVQTWLVRNHPTLVTWGKNTAKIKDVPLKRTPIKLPMKTPIKKTNPPRPVQKAKIVGKINLESKKKTRANS